MSNSISISEVLRRVLKDSDDEFSSSGDAVIRDLYKDRRPTACVESAWVVMQSEHECWALSAGFSIGRGKGGCRGRNLGHGRRRQLPVVAFTVVKEATEAPNDQWNWQNFFGMIFPLLGSQDLPMRPTVVWHPLIFLHCFYWSCSWYANYWHK